MGVMVRIGLDIGTGFVKCVTDSHRFRFPTLYVRRHHGEWTKGTSEAVGQRALAMLEAPGAAAFAPILRGRPDEQYGRQVEMLISEAIGMALAGEGRKADSAEASVVAGLPYYAAEYRDQVLKHVRRASKIKKCEVVAQAAGTLVSMDLRSGIVVSMGQGTTEIIAIDGEQVIDGESSRWASDFITRKISKFAHLDTEALKARAATCKKYAKVLAGNLGREVREMSARHGDSYGLVLSGGGILIPGVLDSLREALGDLRTTVPGDPVMSNAVGLHRLAR